VGEKFKVQDAITQGLNQSWDTMPSFELPQNRLQFTFLNNETNILKFYINMS